MHRKQSTKQLIELTIETLTGTSMELQVSPQDSVLDVKVYIQKLEGIPAYQQHLVWKEVELEDDRLLRDYNMYSGATLRLVLSIRGGPINTRRVPIQESSAVSDMAEYFAELEPESDLIASSAGHRPVTVIVCHSGDQLNFYRLVSNDTTTPVSLSHSSRELSRDEELVTPTAERHEENNRTRDKMKLVRSRMEKEKKDKVSAKSLLSRPPSSVRPPSHSRLYHASHGISRMPTAFDFNRQPCLPPILSSQLPSPSVFSRSPRPSQSHFDLTADKSCDTLLKSPHPCSSDIDLTTESDPHLMADTLCRQQSLGAMVLGTSGGSPLANSAAAADPSEPCSNASIVGLQLSPTSTNDEPATKSRAVAVEEYISATDARLLESSRVVPHASKPLLPLRVSARQSSVRLRGGSSVKLESLEPSEVSDMIHCLMRNQSRASTSSPSNSFVDCFVGVAGSSTPMCATNSVRMRSSSLSRHLSSFQATDNSELISPTLPPINLMSSLGGKKSANRCFVCNKKTGLATAFLCRCGNNFCTIHRYPETHACTFDYKSEGRKLLEQANPVVTASKLPKI